ncbi:MAG: HAMP domain-containing histidine kinase [Phaeodactylibacter sp.]|nr:HAMP domain-containing histidine kinase [Phaeodactylibacter sp.]
MRLLDKNKRIFFRFTALLLLASTVAFYLAVNWIIRCEIDEKLKADRERTVQLLQQGQPLPRFAPIVEARVVDRPASTGSAFSDTMYFDPIEQEAELYRQLLSYEEIGGRVYRIINRASLVDSEDLMFAVGACALGLALLLFLGLNWLNRRSAQRLWLPFQQQLDALKNFSLEQQRPIQLASSGIYEFEELKAVLEQLTEKVRADYRNLKAFTENASHEIQTPLAIISTRIESLVEAEQLTEEQLEQVAAVYEAANRLSRLNRSLLLLAKIENRQFVETTDVPVNAVVREQMELLDELAAAKNLLLQAELSGELAVTANRSLVEILIKNFLENAIRYSLPGDTIAVRSGPEKITFSNPGKVALEHSERLFQRFHKQGSYGPSLGLGLAIAREICAVYGWEATYAFRGGQHAFQVRFFS